MTTINRAYSTFEIKAMEDKNGKRTFSGLATTPSVDRMGDIVEPKGAEFKLPIPFLWQHNSREPIGWITSAKVTDKGIEVEGEVAKVDKPGKLKDRLDEAWDTLEAKLVRGLSIGFSPIESARIEGTYAQRFIKWLWLELSAVTVAANGDCSITAIKAADMAIRRAAIGSRPVVRLDIAPTVAKAASGAPPGDTPNPSPGVSGHPNQPASSGLFYVSKGQEMNLAEQISAFNTKRTAAVDRSDAIMTKAATDGRTLDAHESEEYDGLQTEVKAIDEHLTRLKAHEQTMVAKAVPVAVNTGVGQGAVAIAGSGPISVRRNAPAGTAFTRFVALLAISKGNLMQAEVLANNLYKDMPELGIVMKAAVAAGTTSDTTWAAPLVQYNDMVSEFIELLRPQTILGRLSSLRRVPFNIRIPRQTAGTTGTFVGEGLPAPVKKLDFDNITLPWSKASTICVITAELAKLSNPSAEALVRQDLVDGISQYLDKRLIDPAYPGVANVSPASLTYGVTPRQATGATLAAIDADVRYIMTQFADAELGLATGVWVMSASLAIRLSMMRTNQDFKAFPELTMNGGIFYGLPVIVSNNVTPSGSPGDQHLILINQAEVLLADDNQMMIDVSTEASLEMNDAPSGGATSLRSLWQNGLMGVKVDRWIHWTKRRSQAVQFIDKAQSYAS